MIKRKAEPKQTEIGKQYVITHSQQSRYKTLNCLKLCNARRRMTFHCRVGVVECAISRFFDPARCFRNDFVTDNVVNGDAIGKVFE